MSRFYPRLCAVWRMPIEIRCMASLVVFTQGKWEWGAWCGRDYCRGPRVWSMGVAWGRAAHCRPEYTASDYSVQAHASWPILRLRWWENQDLATGWTGREWRLHSWSLHPPQLRISSRTGALYVLPGLPKWHVVAGP